MVAIMAVAAGCGSDAAEPDGPTVTQRITRDFGRELLAAQDRAPLDPPRTVLALLRRHEDVGMSTSGNYVAEIDGLRWRAEGPDEATWALNVNGIETDGPPAEYRLHPGDVVQWDRRDWYVTRDVRATVGAFPQTFTRGVFGKRFPLTIECADPTSTACRRVKNTLHRAGVATDGTLPQGVPRSDERVRSARMLVGPWRRWHDRKLPRRIDEGASSSGVFARFSPAGDTLHLLDWDEEVVRSIGASAGLVAAMRPTSDDLLWLVTGVDDAGVEHAARALNADDLRDAFAIAVTADGVEKLPLTPSR